jgi:hypothetical protein
VIVKTLAEVQRAVEYEASIRSQIGTGATFRHPTVDITAEINSSYAEFRELLVERDFDFFLEETAQANLPSTRADTLENYSLIDWPQAAQLIKRVDVYKDDEWESLEELDWSQIRQPQWVSPSGRSVADRPKFFSPKSFGTVTAATEAVGKIALIPFATSGKYKISYLPRWTDITNPEHKMIFPSETGFRWTVWNTVLKVSVRDTDPGKRYDKALMILRTLEERIGRFTSRTISTGGTRMRRSRNYHG